MKRNYKNSTVYILYSEDTPYYYINGSTRPILDRVLWTLRNHNYYSYREPEILKYLIMFTCKIEALEQFSCSNQKEFQERIRYWRHIYDLDYLNDKPKIKRKRGVKYSKTTEAEQREKEQKKRMIETDTTLFWDR